MSSLHNFRMRPFQEKVRALVMDGKNVLLQAPTGAGKTRAALAPFLLNLAQQGNKLPCTCRYAVPMRVLANQFYREFESIPQKIDNSAPTSLVETYRQLGGRAIAVQTGEQPDDPQMEAAITFCTIDQLLASVLGIPYGIGKSRANINVGAVLSSYLILDEFHLYPLLRDGKSVFGARTTILHLLCLLKTITPFVLMTATFSSTLLAELARMLDAEVVKVSDEEIEEIAQGRTRIFSRAPSVMDADILLVEHRQRKRNKCTLIVCNSVLRAQNLFLQLRKAEEQGTRVVLLHSRFSTKDRQRLSKEVEEALGPKQWDKDTYLGPDIIVIATQVVEVGLDISVAVLHTENAPASSLVQRAGRCARFAQQQGHVFVYPLPLDEEGKTISTLPYNEDICAATWQALAQFDGQAVGFKEEQTLIDAVHTQEDKDLLKNYAMNEGEILAGIFESLRTNDRGASSSLIRDVSQVQIVIHDNPNEAITEAPWRWQSFSMNPYSLRKRSRWDAWQERGQELDWVCMEAKAVREERALSDGADGIDNRQLLSFRWDAVTTPALLSQALMVALPSHIATYDSQLGFLLLDDFPQYVPVEWYQSGVLPGKHAKDKKGGSRETSYVKPYRRSGAGI